MDTKVYLVQYNNGESYQEDFHEWVDDNVYVNKGDCIQSILDRGYKYGGYNKYSKTHYYTLNLDECYPDYIATILELDVVLELERVRR